MRLKKIKQDEQAVEEGRWFDHPQGGRVKIGSLQSRRFQDYFNRRMKPYTRQSRTGDVDPEIRTRIFGEALAEIVFDWEDFFDEDDQPMEFSKDAVKKLLTDRAYIAFADFVAFCAGDQAAFTEEELKDAEGNSNAGLLPA
jgi:hypothetical protein